VRFARARLAAAAFLGAWALAAGIAWAQTVPPPDTGISTDVWKLAGGALAGFAAVTAWILREVINMRRVQGHPSQMSAQPLSDDDTNWTRRDHKTFAATIGERFNSIDDKFAEHNRIASSLQNAVERLEQRQHEDAERASTARAEQGRLIQLLSNHLAEMTGAFKMFTRLSIGKKLLSQSEEDNT